MPNDVRRDGYLNESSVPGGRRTGAKSCSVTNHYQVGFFLLREGCCLKLVCELETVLWPFLDDRKFAGDNSGAATFCKVSGTCSAY